MSLGLLFVLCWFLVGVGSGRHVPPVASPVPGPVWAPQTRPKSQPPVGVTSAPEMRLARHDHHLDKQLVLSIALSSVAVVLVVLSLCCTWIFWKKNREGQHPKGVPKSDSLRGLALGPIMGRFNSMKLSSKKVSISPLEYSLLETATNNFSDSNILGEGGFGCVYKARFDEDVFVAVKKLDNVGPECEKEFENEMDLLSGIQHPNIVSILGYCLNGQTRFLVYELMQNGSLEAQLHGPSRGSALTWHVRMKIALDIARALEYLHEHCSPPVIHRDLKSSNILLDYKFNAKISDFGLAVGGCSQRKGSIKLSGTFGYVAPEYLLDGKLTEKSDVYAFGVVLLELLIGRRPVEKMAPSQCQSIVTWAMPQLTDRAKLPNILDPVIKDTMDLKHLYQVAAVAVLCVQPEPSYRPLITDVLHSLIPLVPNELGGTLKVAAPACHAGHRPHP